MTGHSRTNDRHGPREISDMKVAMVVCPNTIGNERAFDYDFTDRPCFVCETRIDPSDPAQLEMFLPARWLRGL